jgi:hypothetical protein
MKTLFQQGRRLAVLGLTGSCLAGIAACDKVEDIITPKLPEATQEGKNTFGCLVDDKVWLTYTEHTLDREIEASYSPGSPLSLRAENERDKNAYSYIHLYVGSGGTLQPGTYTVGNGFSATYDGSTHYATSATGPGTVTITKVEPVVNNSSGITSRYTIVSGTFGFTAVDAAGKTVTVQDGRFDVQAF